MISVRKATRKEMSVYGKEYDFRRGQHGPVAPDQPGKTRITIRIDTEILNWFRDLVNERGAGNYQTMINEALRAYIYHHDKPLEETLRKVIWEELQALG
jgi:uncharacterized protein (DUF4415 family)